MSLSGSTRHIKKFMNGDMTPEEAHCSVVFAGMVCGSNGCGRRPRVRVTVFLPVDEMRKRHQLFDVMFTTNPLKLKNMTVKTAHGDYIRISEAYACKSCQPSLEKAAAQAPSYAMVDIFRPLPDPKIIVSG
jgi:hypothetical protein